MATFKDSENQKKIPGGEKFKLLEVSKNRNIFLFVYFFLLQTEFPNDVDIDLDEILDIEDENQRKKFIRVSRA